MASLRELFNLSIIQVYSVVVIERDQRSIKRPVMKRAKGYAI